MRPRLRDFIETKEGWIFSVVDYNNQDGVHCLLRYLPDQEGERNRDGVKYRKMGFDEAYAFIRKERPGWIVGAMVVPYESVYRHYQPHEGLMEIVRSDARIKKMVDALDDIDLCDMGITGSKLVGLGAETSDVDFIVYGSSWYRARDQLRKAIEDGRIEGIDEAGWKKIYAKRKPELSFDEFYLHERRKGNRCILDGALTDLLFVREYDQIGPTICIGQDRGMKTITATVTDTEFAFDSPAIYEVSHPEISAILSYTHTYAGQALKDEVIEARGRIEESETGRVLVVGTSREPKGEWIKSISLLEESR
ncbi:MAG TPA: DNA polymerase subunit beta [Methanocella sp.]|nr:DNA polymerase subunit beta [Methanocella sp.]